MIAENRKSVAAEIGTLYDPISDEEIHGELRDRRMFFFYMQKEFIGFVRLIKLDRTVWELGSAISSPDHRRRFTGFNFLFQSAALLHMEAIIQPRDRPPLILIITYHPLVAASIRRQMTAASAIQIIHNRRFNFSRIEELSLENGHELIPLLHLSERVKNHSPFFVFNISSCLYMPPAKTTFGSFWPS